jgi:hypothetical protein
MSERSTIALQAEFDADCWVSVLQHDRDDTSGLVTIRDGIIRDTINTLRECSAEIKRLKKNQALALDDICGAKLCHFNSMSSRAEMIRLMDSAIRALEESDE